jgi:hypothetical protein
MGESSTLAAPPLPPARHDGDRLVVARGADISGGCLQCAGTPQGGPIVRHLAVAKGALFGRGSTMSTGNMAGTIFLIFCGLTSFGLNPDPKLAAENAGFLWL